MRLTILGSGNYAPSKDRNPSGYLLDIGAETVMLDCGPGSLRQVVRCGRSIWEIKRLFLSHFHIDHINDLVPLLFVRRYTTPDVPHPEPLKIHAHRDFQRFIAGYTDLFGSWIISDQHPFIFSPIESSLLELKQGRVEVFPGIHTESSLIYRFSAARGKKVVYTGDTGFFPDLPEICQRVDILLIECSSSDQNRIAGHMSPSLISELLAKARPHKTVVTHIPPEIDPATLTEQIEVPLNCRLQIAQDLMTIDI